ncbi:uncharacterized protein LOC124254024 [Haliotis rubra]|uniref:uncharacterized protein LOC124254024 n=1 Tax=Haliotis rubra TaxID=36100 RepID=UPI001EE4FBC9|nr:uncharacterized protein LOC124254024 [Haliotis rubra]
MFCEIWPLKYITYVVCIVLASKMVSSKVQLGRDVTQEKRLELIYKNIPSSRNPVVESDIQQTNMLKWQHFHDNRKPLVPSEKTATEPRWFKKRWHMLRTSKFRNQRKSLPLIKDGTLDNASAVQSKSSKTNYTKDKIYSTMHTKNKISKGTDILYHKIHRRKRDVSVQEKKDEADTASSITVLGVSDSTPRPKRSVSGSERTNNTSVSRHEDAFVTFYPVPDEWTAKGNYSAVRKLITKFHREQMIARDAQIAFMCMVFLLCLLSLCVWCTGMCYRKKIHYMKWSFQDSHALTSVGDMLRRRWKHLPEQSFYEEVVVHDRGTDP